MAGDEPAELVALMRRAYDGTVMRVDVTRSWPDGGGEQRYTFFARQQAWRVELEPDPNGVGEGRASLLVVDGEMCFDHAFRPSLSVHLAVSYGVMDFDPAPWACTEEDFGLNPLATFDFRRQDPRWRIENLTTDDQASYAADVVELDGEPMLHLRTTGVTRDGPLDPARPRYDVWIDSDHLPVRMETKGLTWVFDYPGELDDVLRSPAATRRGSYGYAVGPGQGTVKACYHLGHCPKRSEAEAALTWGDGRRS